MDVHTHIDTPAERSVFDFEAPTEPEQFDFPEPREPKWMAPPESMVDVRLSPMEKLFAVTRVKSVHCAGRKGQCRRRVALVQIWMGGAVAVTGLGAKGEPPFEIKADQQGRYRLVCPRCHAEPVVRKETLKAMVHRAGDEPVRLS